MQPHGILPSNLLLGRSHVKTLHFCILRQPSDDFFGRLTCVASVLLVVMSHNCFIMEYIVHDSKNQNDSKNNITYFGAELKRMCDVSTCIHGCMINTPIQSKLIFISIVSLFIAAINY